jgi:hypothetical protein
MWFCTADLLAFALLVLSVYSIDVRALVFNHIIMCACLFLTALFSEVAVYIASQCMQ